MCKYVVVNKLKTKKGCNKIQPKIIKYEIPGVNK